MLQQVGSDDKWYFWGAPGGRASPTHQTPCICIGPFVNQIWQQIWLAFAVTNLRHKMISLNMNFGGLSVSEVVKCMVFERERSGEMHVTRVGLLLQQLHGARTDD
jgi:hypothetical protein